MTLFERIVAREIPSQIVHETEDFIAIRDIAPQAPTHVLVIPKKPVVRLAEAAAADEALLGKLMLGAAEVARKLGLERNGYRLVVNNGRDAGEAVPHLHLHVLGGRAMTWPPG
ncbi:MAG: histidine triad nucleotide-binding protein [Verrucomicrobiae bacterium]|nr:histidine triad nucleotide-binding protein [Verrucomicrobiae bacterium]